MRLEIILKGKNNFKVPFNYNHILSAIIYNKIADLNFLHFLKFIFLKEESLKME